MDAGSTPCSACLLEQINQGYGLQRRSGTMEWGANLLLAEDPVAQLLLSWMKSVAWWPLSCRAPRLLFWQGTWYSLRFKLSCQSHCGHCNRVSASRVCFGHQVWCIYAGPSGLGPHPHTYMVAILKQTDGPCYSGLVWGQFPAVWCSHVLDAALHKGARAQPDIIRSNNKAIMKNALWHAL